VRHLGPALLILFLVVLIFYIAMLLMKGPKWVCVNLCCGCVKVEDVKERELRLYGKKRPPRVDPKSTFGKANADGKYEFGLAPKKF